MNKLLKIIALISIMLVVRAPIIYGSTQEPLDSYSFQDAHPVLYAAIFGQAGDVYPELYNWFFGRYPSPVVKDPTNPAGLALQDVSRAFLVKGNCWPNEKADTASIRRKLAESPDLIDHLKELEKKLIELKGRLTQRALKQYGEKYDRRLSEIQACIKQYTEFQQQAEQTDKEIKEKK